MLYEIYFTGYTTAPFKGECPACFMEARIQYSLERAKAVR